MTEDILEHLNSRARYLGPDDEQALSVTRLNHWRLSRDERDIAWLVFDQQGASANVLSSEVLGELEELVLKIREQAPRAVVLRSAKKTSFCMGADISEFRDVTTESEVLSKLAKAHDVVDSFEALSCPRIAVIHGQCLGGGLELALSCSYRLAIPGARFGFPEVQLGLHPGLGGTVRLPRLINPVEAMKLMLTGKPVVHQKAKKLGLVDDVVEERHVLAAIEAAIAGDLNKHHHGLKDQVMMSGPARQFEARQMRAESAKKAPPEHYPAPGALIDLWENHGGDTSTMAEAEMESFARLLQTETAQNLMRVFFLREKLKGLSDADAQDICHVHVVGAGEMGGDIAGWSALKGHTVTLFDQDPEKISGAIKKLSELCERKHYSSAETREALDRLVPDFANDGAYKSDLIIEAVPEDVDIKRKVYEEVESRMKPGAILATNTSSIPLNELARSVKVPERLVGLHFFNPVAVMPLVEVVTHGKLDEKNYARARGFTGQIERLPVPVSDAPGFLVNRALTPYLMEAILMLDEGVPAESIDRVAEDFGMPMGPVELADQVGLDICVGVADMLRERLDSALPESPDWLTEMVDRGDLGKKTGRGLYTWKKGEPRKSQKADDAPENTLDRLILPMLNACVACLNQKVVESENVADAAMIFGTGFAPFRGGPFSYIHHRGAEKIHSQLRDLEDHYGKRFEPDKGWQKLIRA